MAHNAAWRPRSADIPESSGVYFFRDASDRVIYVGKAKSLRQRVPNYFGLGLHPIGFAHPHYYSHIDALTLGAVRDLPTNARGGRIGLGADVTLYHMSADAEYYWAGSHSYHVFLRWRPSVSTAHHHS